LARVEKHPMRPGGGIKMFSPEEVWALVCAAASEQDGALFLTAVFTGLRMGELLALRWRDVDFAGATIRRASYAGRERTTPRAGDSAVRVFAAGEDHDIGCRAWFERARMRAPVCARDPTGWSTRAVSPRCVGRAS
jgi:integrase